MYLLSSLLNIAESAFSWNPFFFFVSIMFYCILCCKKSLCISVDMVFILSSLQTCRSTVHTFCTKQTTTMCLLSVCSTGHFLFHDFIVFMLAFYFIYQSLWILDRHFYTCWYIYYFYLTALTMQKACYKVLPNLSYMWQGPVLCCVLKYQ